MKDYAPKLDLSAKEVIEGTKDKKEIMGGGDRVLAAVLRGKSKQWVVKVKRFDDAVEEDNTEELTKEEEAMAMQEDEQEERQQKEREQGTKSGIICRIHTIHRMRR